MQPSELCRICGGTGLFLNIFDDETKYSEDLENCLSVKVKPDDGHSQVICHKCLGTLSWCIKFVEKVDLLKNNNPAPSTKLCYSCRSSKGHLFPLSDKSAEKFLELFGLTVLKPKNSKICHECQFSLDCVGELRETAMTSQTLSCRGQHLEFEVTQKNASVDDLVDSLKNRAVEVDRSPRKTTKTSIKAPQTGSRKGENGTTSTNSDEEGGSKKKGGSGKQVNIDKKKSSRLNKNNPKESSSSDNDSPKETKSKRGRRVSHSSDTELNTSTDSSPAPKSKKLVASDENPQDSKRSSRDNNSKQGDLSKKESKSAKEIGKSTPQPKSKRQKLDTSQKQSVESGSNSDSDVCLASIANSDVKDKQAAESLKKSARSKQVVKKNLEEDTNISHRRGRRNSSDNDNKQASAECKGRSESSRASKKVHFVETSKKRKQADSPAKSRKKRAAAQEDASDGDEHVDVKRKKNPPLQEYTCMICSADFSSTVVGKRHELSHDLRFDRCELKLIRLSAEEIASATERKSTKPSLKNELDEDDDLWSADNASKVNKTDSKPKEDAFDALFGAEGKDDSSSIVSSSGKNSEPQKAEDEMVYNTSDSEKEDAEPIKEVGETNEKVEENTEKLDKHSEDEKPDEIPKSTEEKDEVSEKENQDSQGEEQKSACDNSDLGKSDSHDAESRDVKEADDSSESQETEKHAEEKTSVDESNGQDDAGTVTSSEDAKPIESTEEEHLEESSSPTKKVKDIEAPESEVQDPDSSVKESENAVSKNAQDDAENSDLNSLKTDE